MGEQEKEWMIKDPKPLFLKNIDNFNKTLIYPSLSCCYLGDEKLEINEETIESCG